MKGRRLEVLSTRYRIAEQTLIVDFGSRMRVLSSAPKRGGLQTTRYLLNHQVPAGQAIEPIGQVHRITGTHDHKVSQSDKTPNTQGVADRLEKGHDQIGIVG